MASNVSNGKQPSNPDELYFNDMDIRAWERRTAEQEGLVYGDDYGYVEDEGYYNDTGDLMAAAEYEELLFQRTLDKIRIARATGEADVSLTPEELEVYQYRLLRQRVPAVRPQARARPISAPMLHERTGAAPNATFSNTGASSSSSPRSKKNQRRSSIFGGKSKKEKSNSRARVTSNATESSVQQGPPGFLVPGPNGQPMFAPVNNHRGYYGREVSMQRPASPLRPGSRPDSRGNDSRVPGNATSGQRWGRQAQVPPRIFASGEIPGAFPSTPISSRAPTPIQPLRPGSSSSRLSAQDHVDVQASSGSRSRSSTIQQPPKLVPFPVPEYKHHSPDLFQYQSAGHLVQPTVQPQYARRVVSAETPYGTMPRRVPVPNQHATSAQGIQGSYSDPAIPQMGGMAEVSKEGDGRPQVVPQTDDSGSSVQAGKSTGKQTSSGGGKESERRRRRGRRKN